ncbi:endonuclease/exonuclease/phosphatase family protein [Aquiflexum lacus]|uniref:endonuclease/exonuclease/phosphatase family protein n=1 Tax=Aquiflexum lacus TaxID=2483805 RepID=UPI0018961515|nr:endonuclease/exonuclease/phosphatase family protein [Aquiflexum lacus]
MKTVLAIVSLLILLAGLLPVIKRDFWVFRVFDYPRFQKFVLCLTILVLWLVLGFSSFSKLDYILFVGLVVMAIFQMYQIYPFTRFSPKMVQSTKAGSNSPTFSVMVINVYQYNKDQQLALRVIQSEDPDILLLVETDLKWAQEMSKLKNSHPNFVEIPQENTYGMLFYSKLRIVNHEILHLIDKEIPSIEAMIELKSGDHVKIFAIHPKPPVPTESQSSTERDAEILLVAKKIKNYKKPTLVIGDLNDVGWSYTSELFLKISGLLDPRRGRGMFSTFHAKYFFLRWPLDHIFVSEHFTLENLKVHQNIGSDHFPISAKFSLSPNNRNENFDADRDDKETANQKIEKGKSEGS